MLSLCRAATFLGAVLAFDPTPHPEVRSTWPEGIFPGEECLPYDGSKVPDCSEYIDPNHYVPYYHEHSANCSRFWECGPAYETCLFECASCPCLQFPGGVNDPECNYQCEGEQGFQWALTFDEKFHFWPEGPTCVWPIDYSGNCTNIGPPCDCLPWQTCVNDKCSPQCTEDSHCPDGYHCDECGWCVENTGCTDNNQCNGHDAICNIPAHDNCFYCDLPSANCTEGCSTNDNCPGSHPICGHGGSEHLCGCNANEDCKTGEICDTGDLDGDGDNKECIPDGCFQTDENCPGYDEVCNMPDHDNCHWCDDMTCKPGCIQNSNCPELFPICGYNNTPHFCGCEKDEDCPPGYICDGENGCIEDPGCMNDNANCPGFNETCNIPNHENCFYCDGKNCTIGCGGLDNNGNCPVNYPVCGHGGGEHLCGCTSNDDCDPLRPICDVESHECTATPGKVLIDSIKIYTTSCNGCSAAAEGVVVNLLGETNTDFQDGIPCKTNKLDHVGSMDFGPGSAVFNGKLNGQTDQAEKNMMNTCYEGALNSQVNGGNVTWEGEGTWEPQSSAGVCVDWRDDSASVWTCDLSAAGSTWNLVNCEKIVTDKTCP